MEIKKGMFSSKEKKNPAEMFGIGKLGKQPEKEKPEGDEKMDMERKNPAEMFGIGKDFNKKIESMLGEFGKKKRSQDAEEVDEEE